MGKCYCDYCDVFLTHDSVAVRKQHNDGNKHKQNVCEYYRQFIGVKTQKLIDQVVEHFEIKVLHGLVRPTYGFPSVNGVPTAAVDEQGNPIPIAPVAPHLAPPLATNLPPANINVRAPPPSNSLSAPPVLSAAPVLQHEPKY